MNRTIKKLVFISLSVIMSLAPIKTINCETVQTQKLSEQKLVKECKRKKAIKEKKDKIRKEIKEKNDKREKEKRKKKAKLKELSKASNKRVIGYTKIKVTLSYYTSLASENGGYANMTASGVKPQYGCIANNSLPFGTNIYIKGLGNFEVQDRGCSNFNNIYRYDVFIPRKYGESDSEYFNRVNNMGKDTVTAYILEEEKENK